MNRSIQCVVCFVFFKSVILLNLLAKSGEACFCTKAENGFYYIFKVQLGKEDDTTDILCDLQSLKYLPSG